MVRGPDPRATRAPAAHPLTGAAPMQGLESLLVVALVAALAPMIAAALPGPRVPQVVILILAGVLIGPHVLGLADTTA